MDWIHERTPAEWLSRIQSEPSLETKKQFIREATSKYILVFIILIIHIERILIDKYRNDSNLLEIWLEYISLEKYALCIYFIKKECGTRIQCFIGFI